MAVVRTFGGASFAHGTVDSDFIIHQESMMLGVDTSNGEGGNDVIIGDLNKFFLDDVPGNNTITTAINIDQPTFWSRQSNSLVFDDSIPYATILGEGVGEFDFFSVTVGANDSLIADIDFGSGEIGGEAFDSELRLYNSSAALLESNDDTSVTQGGLGSLSVRDSFLTWINNTGIEQTVYLQVKEYDRDLITSGSNYLLNISVTGHANGNASQQDADILNGEDGHDFLIGNDGNDTLSGGIGNDTLIGGNGSDQLSVGLGTDFVSGGNQSDTLRFSSYMNVSIGDFFDGGADESVDVLQFFGIGGAYDFTKIRLFNWESAEFFNTNIDQTFSFSAQQIDQFSGKNANSSGFSVYDRTNNANILLKVNLGIETSLDLSELSLQGFVSGLDRFKLIGDGDAENITGTILDDTINGLGENDTLIGGLGADSLDGGDGSDTADYSASNGAVIMAPGGGITGGHATGDTLVSIENIIGGLFSDTLRGDGGVNQLDGGGGNDILVGGGAADILNGGAGSDTLIGGAGADVQDGGNNSDTYLVGNGDMLSDTGTVGYDRAQIASAAGDTLDISGWSGINRVNGNAGDDSIDGASATQNLLLDGAGNNDTLIGGSGNDLLLGGSGADSLVGGSGNDTMLGGTGEDRFNGGVGEDVFFIGESGDFVEDGGADFDKAVINNAAGLSLDVGGWVGVERINGFTGGDSIDATGSNVAMVFAPSAGADTILGGNGNDTVYAGIGADEVSGSGGNDALIGAAGNDTLNGGADNDFLLGGADADTFAFDNNFGRDVVRDYVDETDMISFQGHTGVNNIGDLSINEVGTNTIITLTAGGTDQITLIGIGLGLETTDFLF